MPGYPLNVTQVTSLSDVFRANITFASEQLCRCVCVPRPNPTGANRSLPRKLCELVWTANLNVDAFRFVARMERTEAIGAFWRTGQSFDILGGRVSCRHVIECWQTTRPGLKAISFTALVYWRNVSWNWLYLHAICSRSISLTIWEGSKLWRFMHHARVLPGSTDLAESEWSQRLNQCRQKISEGHRGGKSCRLHIHSAQASRTSTDTTTDWPNPRGRLHRFHPLRAARPQGNGLISRPVKVWCVCLFQKFSKSL